MKYLRNETGFTLVELTIAMVISVIVTLTAGIIVVSATKDFKRGNSTIQLQQDLAFATELLTNAIRATAGSSARVYTDQTGTEVVQSGACLKIDTLSLYYKSGRDLVFQNSSGEIQRLLINCVDTLNFYRGATADSQKCLNLRIALQEKNGHSLATDLKVYFRN
ncbi:MAG: prepilin-type N-terminal cleavage/methylation domain-containing protein [Candidatus Marinimicrobia bacterium]|jgi:prepilin-type N-terminal cleavage/methylation domain-containing protein|nr:prepilin-type N-terminal cleavage/methylation domain-containing protein [Candidatus Neomarinimicrobiota bacterium]MDD5061177.1 prepilin-type N-terminal cleavage/methylation domain-containing protein [Candidatus Neomarinimicrobiota bacterium]MDD5230606.1 prepilin-type N-terminal cleavage/methylation domain-containing protein [Candidatus Neomarinimicrobiota bacterium]MDD5539751.1 prepilin-type N-terminal cleavage/methylation domain-containing protein [Candidatus Neomarinimicrobiota bacterium]